MISIRNALECDNCPVAWSCCGGETPCLQFNAETKECAIYESRPLGCRNSYCQHMKVYTDGTLQSIMNNEASLLAEHDCETCGGASENIIIDGGATHYYCDACSPR